MWFIKLAVDCEESASVGFSARSRHEYWGERNMHFKPAEIPTETLATQAKLAG